MIKNKEQTVLVKQCCTAAYKKKKTKTKNLYAKVSINGGINIYIMNNKITAMKLKIE